jgi:hypothetical protein
MRRKDGLVRIKDVPYVDIGSHTFTGTLEEVSANVLGIRDKLKECIERINNSKERNFVPITPISDYKSIELDCYSGYEGLEISIEGYRYMTDEERLAELEEERKRVELAAKRIESSKKSAAARKKRQEEEERALFEKLKVKYENKNIGV